MYSLKVSDELDRYGRKTEVTAWCIFEHVKGRIHYRCSKYIKSTDFLKKSKDIKTNLDNCIPVNRIYIVFLKIKKNILLTTTRMASYL